MTGIRSARVVQPCRFILLEFYNPIITYYRCVTTTIPVVGPRWTVARQWQLSSWWARSNSQRYLWTMSSNTKAGAFEVKIWTRDMFVSSTSWMLPSPNTKQLSISISSQITNEARDIVLGSLVKLAWRTILTMLETSFVLRKRNMRIVIRYVIVDIQNIAATIKTYHSNIWDKLLSRFADLFIQLSSDTKEEED